MRQSAKLAKRFDGRTNDARRVKHLIQEYTSVLGGVGRLNIGESNTIHRLCALIVLAERQESQMISFDPKYNPDEHMRNVGKIKLLQDDLDLPRTSRRQPANSNNGNAEPPTDLRDYGDNGEDPTGKEGPFPGERLESWLERGAPERGNGRPKRKRARLHN